MGKPKSYVEVWGQTTENKIAYLEKRGLFVCPSGLYSVYVKGYVCPLISGYVDVWGQTTLSGFFTAKPGFLLPKNRHGSLDYR
jgi:hypothetical protein